MPLTLDDLILHDPLEIARLRAEQAARLLRFPRRRRASREFMVDLPCRYCGEKVNHFAPDDCRRKLQADADTCLDQIKIMCAAWRDLRKRFGAADASA